MIKNSKTAQKCEKYAPRKVDGGRSKDILPLLQKCPYDPIALSKAEEIESNIIACQQQILNS